MLPSALQETYEAFFIPREADREHAELVKAADKLCAYLKCVEEMGAGNREFVQAEQILRASVDQLNLPEVDYFMTTFMPSFRLTLDELH